MNAAELDPFRLDHLEDPYDLYDRLRTYAPVHEIPDMGLFLVSRHRDVLDVVGRPEEFSSNLTAFVQRGAGRSARLVETSGSSVGAVDVLAIADPPDHTRQRKLVSRTFRQIEEAEQLIATFVDEMLDPLVSGGGGEWMDGLAGMLPARVIAALLGLPDGDVGTLKSWSDDGVELLSGVASAERMAECGASVLEFLGYLKVQVAQAPSRAPEGILALLRNAAEAGDLTIDEAVSMALQLVSAGSDSTSNLIGSAARLLAELPDVQMALRQDPELIPNFIEEAVRLESPFRGHFRVTTAEAELAGHELREGSRLFLLWASANRDPEVFARPDDVVLDREHPRSHLGFGWGIHHCVGAPLARLEARLVIGQLLARTTDIRLAPGAPLPHHVPSLLVRRPADIHLRLGSL